MSSEHRRRISAWFAGEKPNTFYAGRVEGEEAQCLGEPPQNVWFVPLDDDPETAAGVWSLGWEWLGSHVTVRYLSCHEIRFGQDPVDE